MAFRILACGFILALCAWAADPVAARLAREAHEAQEAGLLVRAYLLYSEAAAREPNNPTYRAERDSLETAAHLLSKAKIQQADVSADIKTAEKEAKRSPATEPPVQFAQASEWQRDPELQPLPKLQPSNSRGTFHLTGDTKSLFGEVAAAYGIRVLFDPELHPEKDIRFSLDGADFHTAMEALTAVTHTFLFAISAHEILVAEDRENKRNELEPHVLLTFPLPNALDQKDLIEAANAVRSVLNIRTIGWDSENRMVMIRDRVTRARIVRGLMEALLLPKAQVALQVQFMTLDTGKNYNYGLSLQNTFQLLYLGHLGGFQTMIANPGSAVNFLAFGGGATVFGLGLTDATLFASYSNSFSENLYNSTILVDDGQTASLHVGDEYPIPTSLYAGAAQSTPSIYNPVGQFTTEDLGLMLKMTPRVNADENISIDVEADFKTLGTQTIDSVPEVNEREFKGSVTLREGQVAVLAGMDSATNNVSKTGFPWLSGIPGLGNIFTQTVRDRQTSRTLVAIKPIITRLPMTQYAGPQYLLGPIRGDRVVL